MFADDAGTTVRILIDSDNDETTGYYYPGVGADNLVEIYGEDTGSVSTSLLYVFDDTRNSDDWNGFYSLTNLQANATSAAGVANALELQIPNFDLRIDAGKGLKYVVTAIDSMGNFDSTNIIDLSRNEYSFEDEVNSKRNQKNSKTTGVSGGISIDGDFDDWKTAKDVRMTVDQDFNEAIENQNVDIKNYANLTDSNGDTFYYIDVEGQMLSGTNFTSESARIKGENSPALDFTVEEGTELRYSTPVLTNIDQIFILIDTDYNASTGYSEGLIGAEKMIEIRGHYGFIESSIISSYLPVIDEWGNSIDTPAANDNDEIEVKGVTGNYYIYIKSWNSEKDEIEAEIYEKVTLQSVETGDEGSRSSHLPSIPAWNSADWEQLGADNLDSDTDAVDILNADSGSRYDNLMYFADGEYMYFMFFLEGDPNAESHTYGILMEDSANNGDYDYVICSYGASASRLFKWDGTFSEWDTHASYSDSSYYRYVTTDGQEHVAFAVEYSDSFTPDTSSGDGFKAVTKEDVQRAFKNDWSEVRNPTPNAADGDYTTPFQVAVPEFSNLLMPIASVILIVGIRTRDTKLNRH